MKIILIILKAILGLVRYFIPPTSDRAKKLSRLKKLERGLEHVTAQIIDAMRSGVDYSELDVKRMQLREEASTLRQELNHDTYMPKGTEVVMPFEGVLVHMERYIWLLKCENNSSE